MAESPASDSQSHQTRVTRRGRGALAFSSRRGYRKYKPSVGHTSKGIHITSDSLAKVESSDEHLNPKIECVENVPPVFVDAGHEKGYIANEPSSQKVVNRKVCKYFTMDGFCYFGERCRFSHVQESKVDKKLGTDHQSETPNSRQPVRQITRPNVVILTTADVGSEQQKQIRASEMVYLKRRFLGSFSQESETIIRITYNITYPEWPFDVSQVILVWKVPLEYPCALLTVNVDTSELPLPLIKHIDNAFAEYIKEHFAGAEKRNCYSCVGKLLIRWLDHQIFTLFVDGLRKTKIFADAEKDGISLTLSEPKISTAEHTEEKTTFENNDVADVIFENENEKGNEMGSSSEIVPINDTAKQPPSATIEARIEWDNTSGNIASLTISEMVLSLRCRKCQALSFMTCSSSRTNLAHCTKCSNGHSVHLQSSLVHENSKIIAILTPKGCIPIDCVLLSSKICFVCLNCNKEASAENLTYGRPYKTWCFSCHKKCEFEIYSLRFVGNFNAIEREEQSATVKFKKSKKKIVESAVIVEGQPLPNNGTCKHYKKSYRWFRFPCCGKLYPCDLCHNEEETDHEMKIGNRMVCGFCSKEQLYKKASPCVNCHENVTRAKSQFWEGGKGCRDQTVMRRNDTKKHKNSLTKTVSKKQAHKLQTKQQTVRENEL